MQIKQWELKKKRGGRENVLSCMKNNLNKSLREKEVEKKNIYKSANWLPSRSLLLVQVMSDFKLLGSENQYRHFQEAVNW